MTQFRVVAEATKSVLLVVSALFPIVDPLGGAPIFLGLTREFDRHSRKLLARRIAMNSFILLMASFAVGSHVLAFFGISLPVVQVGGGLVVISTGWAMLHQENDTQWNAAQRKVQCGALFKDAFYPLTLPLTVGPGSISVAVTLGANAPHHLGANLLALLAAGIGSVMIALTIYWCYGFSDRLAAVIGPAGENVIGGCLPSCWFVSGCRFSGTVLVHCSGPSKVPTVLSPFRVAAFSNSRLRTAS